MNMNKLFGSKKKPLRNKKRTEILNPKSSFAFIESHKSLRSSLNFMSADGNLKTIMITSTLPDEGKSTIAINLSKVLVEDGKKVLLIDGDLRKPTLRDYLRVKKTGNSGFSSVLASVCSVQEAIYIHGTYQFDVMLAGAIPPNPSELLGRPVFGDMLDKLKNEYDYIIIDTPPIGVVSDAGLIGSNVDGAILVVRQNFAERDAVITAKKRLMSTNTHLIGTVMNYYDASKVKNGASSYNYEYEYGTTK